MAEKNQITGTPLFVTTPTYRSAYDGTVEVLRTLSGEAVLKKPRLDGNRAAATGEASATKLAPYLPQIVATFGEPAGRLVEQLRPAALATRQAEVEFLRADPSGDMSHHEAEVMKSYDLLMNDCESLVAHGFLAERDLDRARDLQGYDAKVTSLLVLVSLLREKWSTVEGHTPLTVEQIDTAELAAQRINSAIAHRDHDAVKKPAADMRHRALVHLGMLNDEARRMMTYLRWHEGDVDEIVPSFWGDRVRKRSELADEEDTSSTQSATPATQPTTPTSSEPELDPTGPGGPFTP
jgi:hypothetical protein